MANQENKIRILVVEDDSATRESIVIKLKSEGFDVLAAADGNEGLEKLKQDGDIALILLDIRMPGVDGLTLLEEKSKLPRSKDIPAIVFSNIEDDSTVSRAKSLGVQKYLLKANYGLKEIIAEVRKYMDSSDKK